MHPRWILAAGLGLTASVIGLVTWWRRRVAAAWMGRAYGHDVALRVDRDTVALTIDGQLVVEQVRPVDARVVRLRGVVPNRVFRHVPIEAAFRELDGQLYGVIELTGVVREVVAGAPLPQPPTELEALLQRAQAQIRALREQGLEGSEVDEIEDALVAGNGDVSERLRDLTELELWNRFNRTID